MLDLEPRTDEAIAFLQVMLPTSRWDLVAIFPSGAVTARTFQGSDAIEEARKFISERQGKANLYWTPNEPRADLKHKKAKAADIELGRLIHVDVDDPSPEALRRLQAFTPTPSAIIFSGGGYQGFWRLDPPTSDLSRVVSINRAVALKVGGDNVHNIDRVMRLPGTINIPNEAKRARGRIEARAYVVGFHHD